ncbi:hypothetical protein AB0B25_12325 [Nocardia sp. NPDC049190]|uniref:AMIN-like domain-containing (lipo)protein n=1 Tax=Nocardia sp. NPDC049190 TaxID=3155650 RepID=UPI0033CB94AB
MSRLFLLVISLVTGVGLWIAPGPAAAAANCAVDWGSRDKASSTRAPALIAGVRSGRHECFDRLVFDITGPVTGYHVGYADRIVMDGSGAPVALRGEAFLNVVIGAPAYDDAGNATYQPANRAELVDVGGYQTFRQVAWAGSFEGQTTVGLGVRGRLPFQVHTLAGPGGESRVMVDIAHSW